MDDYIVCLGSEITGGETDIHTTVENRIVAGNGARLLLDGSECDVTGGHEQTALWTHLEGVGGYVFLDQPTALRLSSQPATQARPESNSPDMSGS
ncbi:polysaccharide lyase family 8 super-sandwich domain-containing protein, partial [Staphylococcus epidermidis]|uniref:polysaccharide lyase family 8 super-sandwich domain-containing protein n=1 Tax=Staphylococcus epidermidis TaxID=1282 RepID=UPI0034D1C935